MTTTQAVVASAVRPSLKGRRFDVAGAVFAGALLFSLLFTLALLGILIGDQLARGGPVILDRGDGPPDLEPVEQAGQRRAAPGADRDGASRDASSACVAFPIGILTAVYLEEYSSPNLLTRFIDINIRNLAGVPSVVYGLMGLAIFVAFFASLGVGTGKNVLSGGLTLAVLVLPLVIITSAEAIRAVPDALREGGYGIGASRWQVVRQLVLPSAAPGILTGTVLALVARPRRDRAADPGRGRPRLLLGRRRPGRLAVRLRTRHCRSSSSTGRASHRRSSGRSPRRRSSSCSR